MIFKKAQAISRASNILTITIFLAYIFWGQYNTAVGIALIVLGVVISAACFPINWKYMRCPYCDHIIPAYRMLKKDECPTCAKPIPVEKDLYAMKKDREK